MPFVLAPELAAVAAAALLAMFCIAVVYLIRAIASALGTFHVGPINIPIGKWFSAITSPVVSWLVGATNELWADAAWWMHGIAYIATGLFDDVTSAIGHAFGFVDHIVTSTIPQAITHVGGAAAGYVNQAIRTIHTDIASATTAIEHVASGDAARALAKAEGFAGTIKASLTRIVAHDLTTAERYTDGAVADVRTWVDGEIAKIHLPTLESIGAAPAALVGTVAGIAGAVAAVASEFESCAVTSCDGPNNLGNLLKGILGFASLAELGVFLSKVINDPAAAEAEYAGIFTGLVDPFITGGGDIWSALESVLSL